jgi:CHAT domain-containing protein
MFYQKVKKNGPSTCERKYAISTAITVSITASITATIATAIPATTATVITATISPNIAVLPQGAIAAGEPVSQPIKYPTDLPKEAASQLKQGQHHYQVGQFSEAVSLWQQATQSFQTQGDYLNQALSLSYLSLAHQSLGQWPAAKQAIAQGLDLLKTQSGLPSKGLAIQAQLLNAQGQLQLAMGQTEAALNTWKAAQQNYSQIKDAMGVVGAQINQAQALKAMGFYNRAQINLEAIHQQLQSQPASPLKVAALRSLGNLWQSIGNFKSAQIVLQQSLELARQLNQSADISPILLNLGNVARIKQSVPVALQYYQQAVETATSPSNRLEAQVNQFNLLTESGQWLTAQPLFAQIQSELERLPSSRNSVHLRVNLATGLMNSQIKSLQAKEKSAGPLSVPPATIAAILSVALQQAQELQDVRSQSMAMGQLGSLYEQTRQWQAAQDLTRQATYLAQSINAPDVAYRWTWQMGRIRQHQGDRKGAIAAYSESVELLKSLRRDLTGINSDMQFSFRDRVEPVYRELVSLLVQDEYPSQSDLKQAREVIEALQQAELENFFRVACLDTKARQIDEVDQSAAVFYPILLSDRLTVILSQPNQPLRVHHTPIAQNQVETTVDKLLESFNPLYSSQERLRLSRQLYSWLIQPTEADLKQGKITTLVFVLDGALSSLPMAALHDGQQYLVEKYNLAIAPGLHLLSPRSLTQEQTRQVLIGGLTESRQGFSALPGVLKEVDQIAAATSSQIYLNQNFTQNNLQTRVRADAYPIVHLATHGQFSSKPDNTFILTWNERINVEELGATLKVRSENSSNPIELLVLSACETATGDKRAALGLAGVAVRSGARSTLATLWAVNDDSTAELMVDFYRTLTQSQVSKAQALRQAQLKLLKHSQYHHPYYWAPFILVGNWL